MKVLTLGLGVTVTGIDWKGEQSWIFLRMYEKSWDATIFQT